MKDNLKNMFKEMNEAYNENFFLSKKKIIVINSCNECPHRKFVAEEKGFFCREDILRDREITNLHSIPEWCRLENENKEGEK